MTRLIERAREALKVAELERADGLIWLAPRPSKRCSSSSKRSFSSTSE